eukprot:GHVN01064871.1.p1 GENE.GHVN01064871.1~~GHVN01064871.1.p1  ORF type:complete len:299 (-),score=53.89 GHVN01064871.1:194-1090(-)
MQAEGVSYIRFVCTQGRHLWGRVPASWVSHFTNARLTPSYTPVSREVEVVPLSSFMPHFKQQDTSSLPKAATVARLLAPIPTPDGHTPVIYGIGLNYKKHAEETGNDLPKYPVVFLKSATSLNDPFQAIRIPSIAPDEVDYEVELGVLIGEVCKDVTVEEAMRYVVGYTVCNDVTARRWQGKRGGGQWCFSKSFDSFTPVGPSLRLSKDVADVNNLSLTAHVNGTERQKSFTGDMVFNIPHIISFLSQSTTLLPGTLICTGTPEGVGFTRQPPIYLKIGDLVQVEIEGIGCLTNPVSD